MTTIKIHPILLFFSFLPLIGLWINWVIYLKTSKYRSNVDFSNPSSIANLTAENFTSYFFYRLFLAQLIWFAYFFLSEGILYSSLLIVPYFLEEAIHLLNIFNKIFLITSYLVIVFLALSQTQQIQPFRHLLYTRLANFLK